MCSALLLYFEYPLRGCGEIQGRKSVFAVALHMISSSYHFREFRNCYSMLCLCVLDLWFPMLLTLRSVTERPSSQPLDDPFLMLYTITEQFQFNICFLLSICTSEHNSRWSTPSANCIPTCAHALPSCLRSVRMTCRRHLNRYSFLSRSSQIESLRVTTVSISFKFIRRLLLRWSATCSPSRRARRQYQIRFISFLRITSTWNIPYIHIKI